MKHVSGVRTGLLRFWANIRTMGRWCAVLVALSCVTITSHAAAPANDTCAAAIQIPGAGPFPYTTPFVDITSATLTGDPPVPAFYTNVLSRSVWYRFTPSANALYTISTCAGVTGSTVNDTVMGMYTSAGGCGGPFIQVAFEDETCNSQAEIAAQLLADTTYYIVVWKYDDGSPDDGMNNLQLRVSGSVVPPNDKCAGAIPLALNVPAFGTTAGAEDNYHIDAPAAFTGMGQTPSTGPGRDVVYSFIAPTAGKYSIRLWNADVTEDHLLYVATNCPSGPLPILVTGVIAAANRSRVNSAEEIFCLPLAANQEIRVFVDHVDAINTGSPFILEVTSCITEVEPNDTLETATPIACGIEGTIATPGDVDFFSLGTFPPDWRAFVLVDGEASRNSDLDLRIVSTNATIEFDDNNNDTLWADSSPNIAGAPLPGGPTFIEVNYNGPQLAEPYRIFAVVQPPFSKAKPEVEPNDTFDNANSDDLNYFRGTLSGNAPSTDIDVYSFNVDTGDLIFLSLDGDPLRNSTPLNARLELVDQFGNVLVTANDGAYSANTNQSPGTLLAFTPYSPGEAITYRFTEEGTFYARVSASPNAVGSAGAGDYLLSISRNCRTGLGLGNSAPALDVRIVPPVTEGSPVQLSGAAIETDIGDSFSAVVFWGDGSSNVMTSATAGAIDLSLSHLYAADTTANTPSVTYHISVVTTDNSRAVSSQTLDAVVQNVAPGNILLTPGDTTTLQGQPFSLGGSFTDPGLADAHTVSINWGDGTTVQTLNLAVGTLSFNTSHIYAIGNSNVVIAVTVTDDDLGAGTASANLHVRLRPTAATFTEIQPIAGPAIRLRLTGTPDGTYRIEKALTFGAWSELGTKTADSSGFIEILDASPTGPSRFYRAVVVQ